MQESASGMREVGLKFMLLTHHKEKRKLTQLLTPIADASIYRNILLCLIRQFQEHVAEADEEVDSQNEYMCVQPDVHPLGIRLEHKLYQSGILNDG